MSNLLSAVRGISNPIQREEVIVLAIEPSFSYRKRNAEGVLADTPTVLDSTRVVIEVPKDDKNPTGQASFLVPNGKVINAPKGIAKPVKATVNFTTEAWSKTRDEKGAFVDPKDTVFYDSLVFAQPVVNTNALTDAQFAALYGVSLP